MCLNNLKKYCTVLQAERKVSVFNFALKCLSRVKLFNSLQVKMLENNNWMKPFFIIYGIGERFSSLL